MTHFLGFRPALAALLVATSFVVAGPTTAPTLPADEVAPPATAPCFPGAYYRKAASSFDHWTGIEVEVVLPTFAADPNRLRPAGGPQPGRPKDNASVYIGGRAGEQEIDTGVTWEVIRLPDNTVTVDGRAFRPFWRNKTWNTAPFAPESCYYPGDTIRMACWTDAPGKLKIRIDLLARAGQPRPDQPISTFEREFDAPNFGPDQIQQFKRVNAIDQAANEGKPAQPTDAHVDGLQWLRATLLRGSNDRRPMIGARYTDMRCPSPHNIRVSDQTDDGGERVDIIGR